MLRHAQIERFVYRAIRIREFDIEGVDGRAERQG
jgi:hypothetical protein